MSRYLRGVTTLKLDEDLCNGCGMCGEVCPHAVLAVENGIAHIVERDACMECGACARNCRVEAITVRAGVGCAQAVINSTLGRSSPSCCSFDDYETPDPVRAAVDSDCGCGEVPRKGSQAGCC